MTRADGAGPLTLHGQDEAAGPLRILVVDDDDIDRRSVRRALGRAGVQAEVTEAAAATEALAIASSADFDCVLLDYNMPGTDGLELLGLLREVNPLSSVVMLTGQGDEQVAVALMKAGAADYLQKAALTPERLASSLRYTLELRRASAQAVLAEAELRESVLRAHLVAEISAVLTRSLDLSEGMDEVARLGVPYLGDYCVIYGIDASGDPVAIAAAHHDNAREQALRLVQREHRPRAHAPAGPVCEAIRTGEPQLLTTIPDEMLEQHAASPELLAAFRELAPSSMLVLPLAARQRTLGAIAYVRSGERPAFTPSDSAVAADIAQRVALAFDNSRLYETAEQARRRTERLQHVTASLAAALPRTEVGNLFIDQVRDALAADTAWVMILNEDDDEFEMLVCGGFDADEIRPWLEFPSDKPGPARDAVTDGRPRWFGSRQDLCAEYPALQELMDRLDQDALAVLPLDAGHGPFGVLNVGFGRRRRFSDEDRALAVAVAGQFAQALERARLYDAERDARERAETANRAKSEFLARMSHDLRTPLNAIGGYAELVSMGLHGPVTDAQQEAIARIQRAKNHLLTLINDILSFAKLEAGQVTIELRPIPVQAVVGELMPLIERQIETRGLRYVAGDEEPVEIVADHERLVQVLLNLMTNAVKFTPAGGTIRLAWDVEGDVVAIHVADTGIGIAQDRLVSIFDPFIQAGETAADQREGVGLGLAISRELVRMMNGELTAASVEGEGSVFTVRLRKARTVKPVG